MSPATLPCPSASRVPPAPVARPSRRVPVAARLCLVAGIVLGGCTVEIQDKSPGAGADPCKPNPCEVRGACELYKATCKAVTEKDGTARAVCENWKRADGQPMIDDQGLKLDKPPGYEAVEASCDGVDNDCDGLVDEVTADAAAAGCPAVGACEGQSPQVACAFGKWQCEFAAAPAWEASETTCDGIDNDCDGEVDEGVIAKATDCQRMGVCAGLPEPVCADGQWQCHYDDAADYEASETKCDGLDNDCDGIADAGLDLSGLGDAAPKCPAAGVCADQVKAVCQGGEPVCDFGPVDGYEPFEQSCDGKDNDCDGKVDAVPGSGLPLASPDVSTCKKQGVCGQSPAGAVTRLCVGGAWQCRYDAVPLYESKETLCDGKDNDCDGSVDNALPPPAKSPCGKAGVCAAGVAQCVDGLWACDFAALGAAGYEAFEQTCDGKDNDCDGQTDETSATAANGCKTQGVCAYGTIATCAAGKATCDYSHVLAFQDVTETLCDGKDNDCDGQTDEPESLDASASGCFVGVCAGKAKVSCGGGKWQCDVAAVPGYEAQETSCDGKDNDCDGQTDEGLTDTVAAKCPTAGVCSAGVTAACLGGKYLCSFGSVAGYEAKEVSCDGQDNDCDGKIDQGACGAGEPCTGDSHCATGSCVQVLGGTGSVCTAKAGQCARLDDQGQLELVEGGQTTCSSSGATSACNSGSWAAPQGCPTDTPVCSGGSCVLCTPNATTCDPQDATQVVQCAADGKSFQPGKQCANGTHCAGAGACVPDAAIELSGSENASSPVGIDLADGSAAVAWLAAGSLTAEVKVRVLGADGQPIGQALAVTGAQPATKGSRIAIARAGSGFAVAWVSAASGDEDVVLRVFDAKGTPVGPAAVAHTMTSNQQVQPALAGNGTLLALAWATDDFDGSGKGIALRLFSADGQPKGDALLANNDIEDFQDPPISEDQVQPALAMAPDGQILVAWTHVGGVGSQDRVRARLFHPDGKVKSGVVTVSSSASKYQRLPTAAFGKNEWIVAWTSEDVDAVGSGIAMRRMDATGKLVGSTQAVNSVTKGNQDEVHAAARADGVVVLGWTSPFAVSVDDGKEIATRDLAPGGALLGADAVLTGAAPAGEQDTPHVLTFADGRVLVLWRHRADAGATGKAVARFR